MSHSKRSYRSNRRLNTTVKVAALVAALGFVTVVLEQPRLTASPSRSIATIEQSQQPTAASATAITRAASEPATPAVSRSPESASEHLPTYFPGQFASPGGEIEAQPATF